MRNESHMNYLRRKTADEAELWAADRIEELERELERERMRLAACSTVALANTPESAAKVRKMLQEYRSASLQDVIRAVDSEMALRRERDALQADNAKLVAALESARSMIGHPDNIAIVDAALAATPAQSLARLRNGVLEEAAKKCEPTIWAEVIRAMKEPE